MSKIKRNSALAAAASAFILAGEGVRQTAYPDPGTGGRPWTICGGHTGPDVKPGDYRTMAQCRELLRQDAELHANKMERCTTVELPDKRYIAFLDFTFNLGPGWYCRSIAPLVNAGRTREACDKLLEFNRAAGIVFPGLTKRRERERAYCLEGI